MFNNQMVECQAPDGVIICSREEKDKKVNIIS